MPDRVVAHLLGDDDPDAGADRRPDRADPDAGRARRHLGRVLAGGVALVYLRDHGRRTGSAVAAAALATAGYGVVGLDLHRLATRPAPDELVQVAGREALLRGAGIVAEPVDALTDAAADALRRLASLPVPVLLAGDVSWDPAWSREVPLQADAPRLAGPGPGCGCGDRGPGRPP